MAKGLFKISIEGIKKVEKELDNQIKAKLEGASLGVFQGGLILEGEIKRSISGQRDEPKSVDTGIFRSSIRVRKLDKFSVSVEDGVLYGKFLEYGTRSTPARKHFANSKNRVKGGIVNKIAQFVGGT